jgi:hypothetical protein
MPKQPSEAHAFASTEYDLSADLANGEVEESRVAGVAGETGRVAEEMGAAS